MLAELALQFFQLHHQARQLFVGTLRIARQTQRTGDGLAEQRELRTKLRHRFSRTQRTSALIRARACLVELGVDAGNRLHHARALCGVIHLQAGHQLGEHVQLTGHHLHLFDLRGQLLGGLRLLGDVVQLLQALAERQQGLVAPQELAGHHTDTIVRFLQRDIHRINRGDIHIAEIAHGQQAPAQLADFAQRLDEFTDPGPVLRLHPAQQRPVLPGDLGHRLCRLLADALDLFVLVEHRLAGRTDLAQQRGRAFAVGVIQPVMRVEQTPRVMGQQLIALQRHLAAVDLAPHVQQIGNTTHQLGIADARHETGACRPMRGELVAAERRLPDLHRMDAGRLLILGIEQHHASVAQEGVAQPEYWILQRPLDAVVDEQRRFSGFAFVEDVQHVLAVGRADRPLVTHALHRGVERLVLAALQVITAREDDAVVIG
ncbi:hypothetical protein D3C71_1120400 [compost metagenome]